MGYLCFEGLTGGVGCAEAGRRGPLAGPEGGRRLRWSGAISILVDWVGWLVRVDVVDGAAIRRESGLTRSTQEGLCNFG
jgi:hypothetical protein